MGKKRSISFSPTLICDIIKLENNFYFFKTFLNTQAHSHIKLRGKRNKAPLSPEIIKELNFSLSARSSIFPRNAITCCLRLLGNRKY